MPRILAIEKQKNSKKQEDGKSAILPGAFDKYRGILVFIVSGMYFRTI